MYLAEAFDMNDSIVCSGQSRQMTSKELWAEASNIFDIHPNPCAKSFQSPHARTFVVIFV
jgi:hypothetical protein